MFKVCDKEAHLSADESTVLVDTIQGLDKSKAIRLMEILDKDMKALYLKRKNGETLPLSDEDSLNSYMQENGGAQSRWDADPADAVINFRETPKPKKYLNHIDRYLDNKNSPFDAIITKLEGMAITKGIDLPNVASNVSEEAGQYDVTEHIATRAGRLERLNQLAEKVGFDNTKFSTQPGGANRKAAKHQNMFNYIKALRSYIDSP